MSPLQVEKLLSAARRLLEHNAAGRDGDPFSIDWAETLLRQNPPPPNLGLHERARVLKENA
jgi:hypothetical protein